MQKLMSTTGEGSGPVTLLYSVTEDNEAVLERVLTPDEYDLTGYLSETQWLDLEMECQACVDKALIERRLSRPSHPDL